MIAASPTLHVARLRGTPWTIVLRNAWLTFLSLAALAQGRWRSLPAAWLPPEVVGLIRLDHALRRGFLQWLPLDKPNTVLILNDERPVRLTHRGVQRDGLACVFLCVDRPDALAAALRVL